MLCVNEELEGREESLSVIGLSVKNCLGGLVTVTLLLGCEEKRPGGGPTVVSPAPATNPANAQVQETDPAKRLFRALLYRDAAGVSAILKADPTLVNQQINGTYALATACESKSLPLVKAVAEQGADLKVRTREGRSMLWAAVNSDSLPIVKYLVEKGCDLKELDADKSTLLWAADTLEMVKYLVEGGVDPKAVNKFGDTALHVACRHSHKDIAEYLIDKGLDVETRGRWKMPPLHSAVTTITGDPRSTVLMLLARGADIDGRGYAGHTALHECAFYNRLEMADLLLSRGAKVNLKDDNGKTPMDLAQEFAGKTERIRMMNLLIRHGAPGRLAPVPEDE